MVRETGDERTIEIVEVERREVLHLRRIVDVTLGRIETLWDSSGGGFYRYAGAPDWTEPATEKTLEDNAEVLYQISEFFAPDKSIGLRFDDPKLGIHWPLPVSCISKKDRSWPLFP